MARFSKQDLEGTLRNGNVGRTLGKLARAIQTRRLSGSTEVKDRVEGAFAVYAETPRLSKLHFVTPEVESLDAVIAELEARTPFSEIGLLVCSRIVKPGQTVREASAPAKTDIARHARLLRRHPGFLSGILAASSSEAYLTLFGEAESLRQPSPEDRLSLAEQLPFQPEPQHLGALGLATAQLICNSPSYLAIPPSHDAMPYAELGVFYST